MVEATKFTARIRQERGQPAIEEKPPLHLVGPDDLPPPPEDDEDVPEYKAFLCTRSKQPARLWLKPEWRAKAYSVQWYPVPVIVSDLDRDSAVPQVIEIIASGGRYRIEGSGLNELMARLNDQHVREIRAYCPKRWPGQRPGKAEPIVTKILYVEEEKAKGGLIAPVPQNAVEAEAEAAI